MKVESTAEMRWSGLGYTTTIRSSTAAVTEDAMKQDKAGKTALSNRLKM
jgi:hypothetical protein